MGQWVSARRIVTALKGRWAHHSGTCQCPAHEDRSPSLSVSETRDGRVLVFCHANCPQRAVIDALRRLGLWGDGPLSGDPSYPMRLTTPYDRDLPDKTAREKRAHAMDLWDRGVSAAGTRAEAYLRARGIRLPMSPELRYVPALKHYGAKKDFPVMLARISDSRGFCALQRTYLDVTEPRKADVEGPKMTLGPMASGAVRLRIPRSDMLGLAEGIETALSASQLYAMPVWATLSANRLARIDIPPEIRVLTIFGDGGDVGKREAFAAQDYYESKGLHVEVIFPAAHFLPSHSDFNDSLRAAG